MSDRSNLSGRRYNLTNLPMKKRFRQDQMSSSAQRYTLSKVAISLVLAGMFLCSILWLIAAPVGAAGITVWKTASANTVKAGEPFTYTIHALNTTGNQINLVITDTVPTGAQVIDFGGGTLTNGVMRWPAQTVDHGSTIEAYFVVMVEHLGTGQVVNDDYQASSTPNYDTGDPVVTAIIPNDPANITIN
jgi:uncharacterized repeat protein (TIGR01451 family)